jgi:hypothetical protein
MRVIALKEQVLNGRPVKAGAGVNVGTRYAKKLIGEGRVRAHENERAKKVETK